MKSRVSNFSLVLLKHIPGSSEDKNSRTGRTAFIYFYRSSIYKLAFPGSSAGKESACSAGDPGLTPGSGSSPGEGTGHPLQCSWASKWLRQSRIRLQHGRPRLGRSPGGGHGNPLQDSCLENPMDRGAWQATVHGVAKSQTRLSD